MKKRRTKDIHYRDDVHFFLSEKNGNVLITLTEYQEGWVHWGSFGEDYYIPVHMKSTKIPWKRYFEKDRIMRLVDEAYEEWMKM